MIIDITNLLNSSTNEIKIDECIDFDKSIFSKTDIIRLDNISVSGSIYVDSSNSYHIDLDINGVMVLPCSVTLKEVNYEFSSKVEEVYDENEISNYKKYKNSIDIIPILWENIILEIPLRVVSDDAYNEKLEGDGWRLITDNNQEGEE